MNVTSRLSAKIYDAVMTRRGRKAARADVPSYEEIKRIARMLKGRGWSKVLTTEDAVYAHCNVLGRSASIHAVALPSRWEYEIRYRGKRLKSPSPLRPEAAIRRMGFL